MEIVMIDSLTAPYVDAVRKLLYAADREFIPALSARNDTTQQSLSGGSASEEGPKAYFEQMLSQAFVLALEEGKVIGFLSYIPDRLLEVEDKSYLCDYVSTIVVAPEFRNRGITKCMYKKLISERRGKAYATRTWSLNGAHLYLLKQLGFQLIWRIEDDRGPGIDTVYYWKENTQDERKDDILEEN